MKFAAEDAAHLKTLTVLLVEDDPDAREALAVFLSRRAGILHTSADGVEGLEAYRSLSPDIVVSDIQMPRMDGLSMIRAIRAQDPAVPVIVTTAFEMSDYLMRSIEIGIDRYVLKPVQGEQMEAALLHCAHRLLAEEQLRRKERAEAEAVKARHQTARSLLLGGIAHDYNNLLQAILTAVDLAMLKTEPDSVAYQVLETAQRSSLEARLLSRRLMSLDHGAGAEFQVGGLDALVQQEVKEALAGSRVQVAFALDGGSRPVKFNRKALSQVFRNLAENAGEAMPGGGALQVATEALTLPDGNLANLPPGPYLRLRFQDTGPGIPAEHLPMLFEPYFSTKVRGRQRGMGLGLALCEATLRRHGGAITVESLPGQGATFLLYLPQALDC